MLCARSGLPVVSDLRGADIAHGGQGAPLAPVFHKFLFGDIKQSVCVLNIGGISNITDLKEDGSIFGYDVGPGNGLMDSWIEKNLSKEYDAKGAWARGGRVVDELLMKMKEESYFQKKAPKSTGREYFNLEWVEGFLKDMPKIDPQDVQATLLELSAFTIAKEVKKSGAKRLFLCGGGAKNIFLKERIKDMLPQVKVEVMQDSDFLEAMLMAYIAYLRINNIRLDLTAITGSKKAVVLGALYDHFGGLR